MSFSIADRSVIVTGASKGIGLGIARVFAEAGARVLLVSRSQQAAEAAAETLRTNGARAYGFAADISSEEGCAAMAEAALELLGGIDVLCANAGIFPEHRLENLDAAAIDSVLATNVRGTVLSVRACLPALKASGHGRIVLTSSITGPITGFPGWAHYGASKAAQLGYMRTAAIELAPHGITINAVLPGNVPSEGVVDLGEDYVAQMTAAVPMKRLGTVTDVGNAALFFATDEAAYITGQTLVVDGGQVLPESLEAATV
ncbi:3-oxoacyl-ACP reductase FabG [Mycobacterium sp. CBMA293]|uniref:3-oxoacyl-ACP reductase FabG n=1 Tax=unclassified Mycolicibacterium TaxID=2636767 RepID=UPI0012DFE788|nr:MULTISPECIES: 3-oxoacyl-ACP reductase FabG [unclassified Mycolicibacterium]MUL48922.1 3-oxoacyl-ACP reductase FabG [Mycolicibacterium sp. CBMA 360]MUL62534.1 3-oxoacyl-ACP reductase FabG [Mycolicibacterium sp. CBMA 335]MUL74225.1 3-oxoacyl-ACP reductase FabG [Mycolicibacterium sp. CBMA 311]MUL96919.1 3-oxoacyl-ACP reductase FabG [Mycolicibacterium sp. CBMA 230]MUM03967.1 3-oxoacyl-ACP reductase [Mycolicibacterium sp. CBMA 213]